MNTHFQQPQNMSNDDIIAMARRIREEENNQLQVRPWKSRNRMAWYITVPAACLVGFFLGYCLRPASETPQGLTALATTDTVYVQEVVYDTIYQTTDVHKPVRPRPITAANQASRKIGISVLEDNIRYDLLASHNDPSMY